MLNNRQCRFQYLQSECSLIQSTVSGIRAYFLFRFIYAEYVGPEPGGDERECLSHAAHSGTTGTQGSNSALQDGQVPVYTRTTKS
jgi:hypothetical protein